MPTYTFYDTVTQEEYEEFMSISELDEYKKRNSHVNQVYTPIAVVGDHVMGVGPKVDGGFTENMQSDGSYKKNQKLNDNKRYIQEKIIKLYNKEAK